MTGRERWRLRVLQQVSWLLLVAVFVTFGLVADRFLTPATLVQILVQSAATAILATGMTFVLLTAGVDLSVGAIMFVVGAVVGKLVLAGIGVIPAVAVALVLGAGCGAFNGLLITVGRVTPFIATLATLFIGRGLALWLTETSAMNLPGHFTQLGSARWLGIPAPLLVLAGVLAAGQWTLARTPFGRQLYALGADAAAARKAGVPVARRVFAVYVVCGVTAALGGLVSLAQLSAVSPTFGWQKEFAAIAAAVLGGTSLFGGRGGVLPGTLVGAVLIQTIESGLVMANANAYAYPLITGAVIFVAVLTDSLRARLQARWNHRRILPPGTDPA